MENEMGRQIEPLDIPPVSQSSYYGNIKAKSRDGYNADPVNENDITAFRNLTPHEQFPLKGFGETTYDAFMENYL